MAFTVLSPVVVVRGPIYGRKLWLERGQTTRYQVGVYEVDHARVLGQILARERGLAGAVWTGDNNATGLAFAFSHVGTACPVS
ncbi:MAG: hypothetical protein WA446_08405 [Steroidobacteraceae bacterium]